MLATTALFTLAFALLMGQTAGSALPQAGQAQGQALEARKVVSDIDVAEACEQQYNGPYKPGKRGSGCDDWYCDVDGNHRGLNMDKYCTDKFGSDAYAMCRYGIYNWRCHDRT